MLQHVLQFENRYLVSLAKVIKKYKVALNGLPYILIGD